MEFWESWTEDQLTEADRLQYEITPSGEAFYSGRTQFRVACRICGAVVHDRTTDPSYWINSHKCEAGSPMWLCLVGFSKHLAFDGKAWIGWVDRPPVVCDTEAVVWLTCPD